MCNCGSLLVLLLLNKLFYGSIIAVRTYVRRREVTAFLTIWSVNNCFVCCDKFLKHEVY